MVCGKDTTAVMGSRKRVEDDNNVEGSTSDDDTGQVTNVSILYDQMTDDHIIQLTELYQRNWWCQGRQIQDVRRMVQNCINVALVVDDGPQPPPPQQQPPPQQPPLLLPPPIPQQQIVDHTTSTVLHSTVRERTTTTTTTLIGYSRVITDSVFKAMIFDVMVDERYQGQGFGRQLINAIMSHPIIGQVQHIELYCHPTMEPFYNQWGFINQESLGGNKIQLLRRTTNPNDAKTNENHEVVVGVDEKEDTQIRGRGNPKHRATGSPNQPSK